MADDQQQQPPMVNDKHVLEPQTNGFIDTDQTIKSRKNAGILEPVGSSQHLILSHQPMNLMNRMVGAGRFVAPDRSTIQQLSVSVSDKEVPFQPKRLLMTTMKMKIITITNIISIVHSDR
ncbi:hypothetical protein BLOT_011325 [Blomia tropicalis]|nr:hypothetical protein BLOT_011325 [Blomia tropicalis]